MAGRDVLRGWLLMAAAALLVYGLWALLAFGLRATSLPAGSAR